MRKLDYFMIDSQMLQKYVYTSDNTVFPGSYRYQKCLWHFANTKNVISKSFTRITRSYNLFLPDHITQYKG